MLEAVHADGTIEWYCTQKVCAFHKYPLAARVDHATVHYLRPLGGACEERQTLLMVGSPSEATIEARNPNEVKEEHRSSRGDVIALPKCLCGTQMFLKADYTLDELLLEEALINYRGANGEDYGYILKIQHVRNMLLHHMLYHIGKAPTPPILPLPPKTVLANLLNSGVEGMDHEVAFSLWFTCTLVGTEHLFALSGFDRSLLQRQPVIQGGGPVDFRLIDG